MVGENSDNISVLSYGNLAFVLNIIIIIIIILASASTLSAGYCNENEIMILLVEVAGLW